MPANRLQIMACLGGLKRLAQSPNVNIDGALFDIDVRTPDAIEKLGATVNALGMGHEKVQQAVFGGSEPDLGACSQYPMPGRIQLQRACGNDLVIGRPGSSQYRLDAGNELEAAHIELLRAQDIVTELQLTLDHERGGVIASSLSAMLAGSSSIPG